MSLMTVAVELGLYYFLPNPLPSVLVSLLLPLILTKFFLESSLSHETIFMQTAITMILTFLAAVVIFMMQPNAWISFHIALGIIVLFNWMVPVVYCTVYALFDRGPRIGGYISAFHKCSILLLVIYGIIMLDRLFVRPLMPPYPDMAFGAHDFVPFMEFASRIEEYLREGKSILPILKYALQMCCFGIPLGFYLRLYLRNIVRFMRIFLIFAIPLLIELLQNLTGRGRGAIDDYCMALVGIVIGIILYYFLNFLFRNTAHHDFLRRDNRRLGKGL